MSRRPACAVCNEVPNYDPGTRGASLAAPTAHTSEAALQSAAAAAAAPKPPPALASTTPPASFEWARLNEINLDDLRRLNLIDQDEPRNNATARDVFQPLVAGQERAGRTRTAPTAPSAAEGWKYYYRQGPCICEFHPPPVRPQMGHA